MTDRAQPLQPLKVLHIGKYFPPYTGGMETYLRDVMTALARSGVENRALVHQSEISFRSTEERIPAGQGGLGVTRAAVWARALFMPLSPTFPFLLNRLIREQQPDLLHLHLPNASAFWALLVPRARRVAWTIHWHSDVPVSEHKRALRWFYRLYRPFERALLKRARRVVATSSPYLESSAPLRDFRDKCVVVPLGLDPTHLGEAPSPAEHTASAGTSASPPLRVLAVGRLTYYKGFEYLLRAAAQVPAAQVDLVGTGELEASLRELAGELQLNRRVTFHGRASAEELRALLDGCDCLCLPSIERSEAFGIVLLEAMYCRRATVASNLPGSGMTWVVQPGVTGELVAPRDAQALAGTLRKLSGDRGKLARFGAAGRERFDAVFHIEQSAESLRQVFAQVCSETTPALDQTAQ